MLVCVFVLAAVAMVAIASATTAAAGDDAYVSIARVPPGEAVSVTAAAVRAVADFGAALTLGSLALALTFSARGREYGWSPTARWCQLILQLGSGVWSSAALALIVLTSLDTNGLSFAALSHAENLGFALTATPYPRAWMVTFAVSFIIFCASVVSRSWSAYVACLWFGCVATLAPVVIGQVLVGPNHDFGSDGAIIGTPLAMVIMGALLVASGMHLADRSARGSAGSRVLLTRVADSLVLRLLLCLLVVVDVVVTLFKLSGGALFESVTGWQIAGRWLGLALVAAGILCARRERLRATSVLFALGAVSWLGLTTAMTRVPSPNYFVETPVIEAFLGYSLPVPLSGTSVFTEWRVSVLFTAIAVVGIGIYLASVRMLIRRGDRWPISRTVCWTIGMLLLGVVMSSGLSKYSGAAFGVHMIMHMILNMVIPIFLVLGGPLTLFLRATTGGGPRRALLHRRLTQLISWPALRLLLNPVVVFLVYIGSYYLLYLTPLFESLIRFHWGHQLMNVHFLIVGYMFFSLVIGVDRLPVTLPHIGKLGYVIAAMPFHAFFGIVMMSTSVPVALNYFRSLDLPWNDIAGQQALAGGVAWAGGELPLLAVVIILGVQWTKQDKKAAKRFDRHEDSGRTEELDAYNEMLKKLADRDGDRISNGRAR